MITAGYSTEIIKYIVNTLVSVTCDGEPVSSLFGCVSDGTVCSNRGTCGNHTCNCDPGFEGTFCESALETSSSNAGPIIGIVIGTQLFSFFLWQMYHSPSVHLCCTGVVVPVVVVILIVIGVVLFIVFARRRRKDENWEIGLSVTPCTRLISALYINNHCYMMWAG